MRGSWLSRAGNRSSTGTMARLAMRNLEMAPAIWSSTLGLSSLESCLERMARMGV